MESGCRTRKRSLLALFLLLFLLSLVNARTLSAQEPALDLLLLEVRLDQTVLSSAMPAYDVGPHTLVPLGELARLLGIAIETQPDAGTASGFILSEDRGFSLDLKNSRVTRAGTSESFDPAWVRAEPDDLYVAKSLIEQWLPIELDIDRFSLTLRIHPLEVLPLQARLNREKFAGRMGGGAYTDPGYPRAALPYQMWSPPFIDQSLTVEYREDDGVSSLNNRYTAHLSGDLLGMESSMFISQDSQGSSQDVRVTLGRYDPDAGLLGPLQARSYQLGSLSASSVENITHSRSGHGVSLSNRPLARPTQFDRQSFEGDLTPGWDVELFYNDALVDFQQADSNGRYRFEDMPLSYGRNDFKLVFNGPLGQTRVEQYSYSLADAMVQPGEFEYNFLEHRDEDGLSRSIAQFDFGLSRSLSTSAGVIIAPVDGVEHRYVTTGVRTFWQSLSLGADLIKDQDRGSLIQLDLKTRIANVALDASRIYMNDFNSDVFHDFDDPILTRDELRLSGAIPINANFRMPVTVEAMWDEHESGRTDNYLSTRISAYAYRTAFTNTLNWRFYDGQEDTYGEMTISRRIQDMNVRGQISYTVGDDTELSVLALTADKFLGEGYRLTLGVAHQMDRPETQYIAGFTKSLGKYGLGANASYLDTGDIAVGLQFFLALGHDSSRANWLLDARPMASAGAASVRMFLDANNNGTMDPGEDPLSGVGFTVDGGRNQARTDAAGIAHIARLPVKQRVNIGVDTLTLEDPQWAPQAAGSSLVPRPGRVAELDFPVRLITEIDGTVYMLKDGVTRGMGGLQLELLDSKNEIVAQVTSSWDGFYIVPGIGTGEYRLRISPQQLQRLGLETTGPRALTVAGDGVFINGIDWLITPQVK